MYIYTSVGSVSTRSSITTGTRTGGFLFTVIYELSTK